MKRLLRQDQSLHVYTRHGCAVSLETHSFIRHTRQAWKVPVLGLWSAIFAWYEFRALTIPPDTFEDVLETFAVWGVWFGRPYDNCHRIVGCDAAGDAVRIRFDHDEVLSVFSPRRASIDRRTFRIDDADRVLWEWFRYGGPQTAENRCFREFIRSTAGAVAARTNDNASGPLTPIGSEPAVEIV